jgi:hypothetical protein
MKDSNDAQTIDWVDEVEVVSKEVATPDLGFHITEKRCARQSVKPYRQHHTARLTC